MSKTVFFTYDREGNFLKGYYAKSAEILIEFLAMRRTEEQMNQIIIEKAAPCFQKRP